MQSSTRKITFMGVLIALSIVLFSLIRFPIFPAAPFLEYEPADIPILIGTFVFGPMAGLLITIVESIIQGLTVSSASGFIGILMHIFATGSFAVVTGFLYKRNRSKKGTVVALVAGVLTMTVTMVIWNLIFTPLFFGTPIDAVIPLVVPIIIPFNLIKAGVNGTISFLIYNRIKYFVIEKHGMQGMKESLQK